DPTLRLQSAGNGSLEQHADGSWSLAHPCRRPLPNGRSILGRETALQDIACVDGWPRLANGTRTPADHYTAPALPPHPWPAVPERDDFDAPRLGPHWQSPRAPIDEAM